MRIGRTMPAVAVLCICFVPAIPTSAQSTSGKQSVVSNAEALPIPAHAERPRLSLENALTVAKSKLKSPVETSLYWLYGARFTLYGDSKLSDKDKAPCWHFTWLSEDSSRPAIEVLVFMNGDSMLVPTL
jgi:hypothetical protein